MVLMLVSKNPRSANRSSAMDANSSCRASCLLVRDFFSIALFTGDYLKALRRSLITSFYQLCASNHTAVDGNDLTGDVSSVVRCEITHQARDLEGGAGALHRNQIRDHGGVERGSAHVGGDDARSHRVDRDAAAGHLEAQRLRG